MLKREGRNHLIMLRPRRVRDAESVARTIAMCDGVESVCLTSGKYAFVVSASRRSANMKGICGRIRKAAGNCEEMSVATNHYVYSRAWRR